MGPLFLTVKKNRKMENNHQQSKLFGIYDQLKQKPVESLTPEELSDAIKQNIRCIGLIPEGMQVEGMPNLSKQEIEDIKSVSNADIIDGVFRGLPKERKTELVCLAAVQADNHNFLHVPEKYRTDELILNVLRKN